MLEHFAGIAHFTKITSQGRKMQNTQKESSTPYVTGM
jgi:hypothetical protein